MRKEINKNQYSLLMTIILSVALLIPNNSINIALQNSESESVSITSYTDIPFEH